VSDVDRGGGGRLRDTTVDGRGLARRDCRLPAGDRRGRAAFELARGQPVVAGGAGASPGRRQVVAVAGKVPAVASAVRVIERLAAEWPGAVTPRQLVDELQLNRSTCYHILSTLQSAGWVRSLSDRGGWTLGPRLLTLTGVSRAVALRVMQDEIEDLSRRLGFVVFIAERDGSGGYVVVAKAERRRGVRVTVSVGEYFEFRSEEHTSELQSRENL